MRNLPVCLDREEKSREACKFECMVSLAVPALGKQVVQDYRTLYSAASAWTRYTHAYWQHGEGHSPEMAM